VLQQSPKSLAQFEHLLTSALLVAAEKIVNDIIISALSYLVLLNMICQHLTSAWHLAHPILLCPNSRSHIPLSICQPLSQTPAEENLLALMQQINTSPASLLIRSAVCQLLHAIVDNMCLSQE
jgi:hypothetical protein